MVHSELYKRLPFDNTTKLYLHKSESLLGNEMHKNI